MSLINELLVNAIVAADTVALVAVGFAIIFRIAGFFHFALAAIFTIAAYSSYFVAAYYKPPLMVSLLSGVCAAAIIGCALDVCVFRRLLRKGASYHVLLLVSLGMYVVLHNVVSLCAGDNPRNYPSSILTTLVDLAGVQVTIIQLAIIATSIVTISVIGIAMKWSHWGKVIRAIATDSELAEVSGIKRKFYISAAFAVGSALAGLGGIMVGLDTGLTTGMGMNALFMGVVAAIIGGIGRIPGLLIVSLLLGVLQQTGMWWFGSQWQDPIVFLILLVFLIVRPEGVMGKRLRKATA